jgi:hypothetical protein
LRNIERWNIHVGTDSQPLYCGIIYLGERKWALVMELYGIEWRHNSLVFSEYSEYPDMDGEPFGWIRRDYQPQYNADRK